MRASARPNRRCAWQAPPWACAVERNAQYERQRLSDNGLLPTEFLGFNWYDQSDLGVSVRYQFDWWGKQRAAIGGRLDRSRASAAERQVAELALAAAVSEAYFGWQADAARIALHDRSRSPLLEQQRSMARAPRAARSLSAPTAAILLRQSRRHASAKHAGLQRLAAAARGAPSRPCSASSTDALPPLVAAALPRPAAGLPADVGTDLLARRPDIAASRWRVEAALRETDSARASFYPGYLAAGAGRRCRPSNWASCCDAGSAAPRSASPSTCRCSMPACARAPWRRASQRWMTPWPPTTMPW